MEKLSRAEQARANGRKSRGPVSQAGKARSAQNAVSHGMTARSPVLLGGDDRAVFYEHRQAYLLRFQPADIVEANFVNDIADAHWNLSRYCGYESALEMMQLAVSREDMLKHFPNLPPAFQQARAFDHFANSSKSGHLALRYMAHWQRVLNNALRNLRELQASRPPAPGSEPDSAPEPEESGYETNQPLEENKELTKGDPSPAEPGEPEPGVLGTSTFMPASASTGDPAQTHAEDFEGTNPLLPPAATIATAPGPANEATPARHDPQPPAAPDPGPADSSSQLPSIASNPHQE
ncbi:hypothetical protein [Paludibaculum fermentans]|uniref:hypothetical protein n=1 Tax=Paludibaculum fermentans TaxID=1473598 RepID=UPI003EBC0B73